MNFVIIVALLDAYKWLICYLLEITAHKFKLLQEQGENQFTARNETQVFYAKTLSLAFIEVSFFY